jgi:hypothetical protein
MQVSACSLDDADREFWRHVEGYYGEPRWPFRPTVLGIEEVCDLRLQLVAAEQGQYILLRSEGEVVGVWPATDSKTVDFKESVIDPSLVIEWENQGISGWDVPHKVIHEAVYPRRGTGQRCPASS